MVAFIFVFMSPQLFHCSNCGTLIFSLRKVNLLLNGQQPLNSSFKQFKFTCRTFTYIHFMFDSLTYFNMLQHIAISCFSVILN